MLRQTEWENFLPPFWRQDPEDEATQPAPLPQGNGAGGPVVDGSGSLLGCNCPVPPQFNPVCGSDGVTYGNLQKLNCARSCGKSRFSSVQFTLVGSFCTYFLLPFCLTFISKSILSCPRNFYILLPSYLNYCKRFFLFFSDVRLRFMGNCSNG